LIDHREKQRANGCPLGKAEDDLLAIEKHRMQLVGQWEKQMVID